jgi:hypothetical protein
MMNFICTQSWIPLREAASSASEMVTALLFGETCTLVERKNDWLYVACNHDNYCGWVPDNYVTEKHEIHDDWNIPVLVHGAMLLNPEARIDLSPGSLLPSTLSCILESHKFMYSDARAFVAENHDAVSLAKLFLHSPYLWGGRSVWGVDCSGLTQVTMGLTGKKLPRDASQQVALGADVQMPDALPGDLAFFEKNGSIHHVGIVLPNQQIIHASGRVRIDNLTEKGILHQSAGKLTHQLACIKRV